MIKVGILGSVGSGKSFVANIFKELGFNIFSADQVVSQIYERNKNINNKISIFKNENFRKRKTLNFSLKKIFFINYLTFLGFNFNN